MYRVYFDEIIYEYLSWYFRLYRQYYQNLYQDSWLWSEDIIIKWYNDESQNRKKEILDLLENCLSEEKVFWKTPFNTIVIKWRTKYLIVEWSEDNTSKKRTVNSLDIR